MTTSPLSWVKNQRAIVVLHFVSFALLYLPMGIGWYIGNLAVYLNSYWYAKLDATTFSTQWVFSAFIMTSCATVIFAGRVILKVNQRILIIAGILFFDTAFFLGSITMRYSQTAFIMSFGILTGLGYGCIQTEVISRISFLVAKRTGLAFGITYNYFNIGAIIYQFVGTLYINPSNEEADVLVLGEYKVFRDKDVIDRVPNVFVVLGIITTALQVSGLVLTLLLGDHGFMYKNKTEDEKCSIVKGCSSVTIDTKGVNKKKENQTFDSNASSISESAQASQDNKICLLGERKPQYSEETMSVSKRQPTDVKIDDVTLNSQDMDYRQMIKTVTFYVLWLGMFANDASYFVLLNFYKVFGEIWIADDHFVTYLGVLALISALFMRMIFACISDFLGSRATQLSLSFLMTITFVFYYFSPQINRWLFAFCTMFGAGLCSGVFALYPVFTLKIFGRTHFATNYGFVVTATIVLNITASSIVDSVLHYTGWEGLFIGTGGLNAVSLMSNILELRNTPTL